MLMVLQREESDNKGTCGGTQLKIVCDEPME
jgi:hypothetical protein